MTIPNAAPGLTDFATLEGWLRDLVTREAHDAAVQIDDNWSSGDYVELHLRRGARTGATLRVTRADAVLAASDPTHLTERLRRLMLVL